MPGLVFQFFRSLQMVVAKALSVAIYFDIMPSQSKLFLLVFVLCFDSVFYSALPFYCCAFCFSALLCFLFLFAILLFTFYFFPFFDTI